MIIDLLNKFFTLKFKKFENILMQPVSAAADYATASVAAYFGGMSR